MAKKISLKGKKSYLTYKALSHFSKNKIKKIARHIKKYPDDVSAKDALKAASNSEVTRKKPNTRSGWVNRRDERFAKLTKAEAMAVAQIAKHEKKVRNEGQYDKKVQSTIAKLNEAIKDQPKNTKPQNTQPNKSPNKNKPQQSKKR